MYYVVAEDTDVLILLIHHTPLPKAENIVFSSKGGEVSYNIGKIIDALDDVIKDNILVLHAWSGCDIYDIRHLWFQQGWIDKQDHQAAFSA